MNSMFGIRLSLSLCVFFFIPTIISVPHSCVGCCLLLLLLVLVVFRCHCGNGDDDDDDDVDVDGGSGLNSSKLTYKQCRRPIVHFT